MNKPKSRRPGRREFRERQKNLARLKWVGLAVLLAIGIGYVLWGAFQPAVGQSIPVMADTSHVPEGTDPGPFNSDPPTSGTHYSGTYQSGFYEETSPEAQASYPEGYLVHNLEHGYVIFWYNCAQLNEQNCDELKSQIQSVLDAENNFKVIAFPRSSIDFPVVLTSWGQMMEFERFDTGQARDFVRRNRNKAPEPNAP
jgi:hypothetical protein